jgi:uncharacterized membrane protein
MLLAWVDRAASGKVPLLSGWMVFALLVASLAMFIALIERVGLLQVTRMLIFTGDQGRRAIDELYPSLEAAPASMEKETYRRQPVTQTLAYAGRPQALQAVDVATLLELASQSEAVLEVATAIGSTVLEAAPLLRVYGARQQLDEQALRNAIQLGDERTFRQDPKFALRLLVDIAIKALSPAINDPTTAVQALDQVEDLMLRLGRRRLEIGQFRHPDGTLRLVIPFPTWDDFLRLALDEILFCGATSVQVMRRMRALIKNLLTALPEPRHPALRNWEQRLDRTLRRAFADAEEKQEAAVADRQGLGLSEE